jgi:spore coat polysaccharide biosynthesis predicted glycosyltransferase SpsG
LNLLLACSRSKTIGLGHFSRMLALGKSLSQKKDYNSYFSVLGENGLAEGSKNIKIDITSEHCSDYFQLVRNFVEVNHIKLFVMDFHVSAEGPMLLDFLIWAKTKGVVLVAIDSLIDYRDYLDHIWLPSVYFDLSKISNQKGLCDVSFGWDHFLLERSEPMSDWRSDGGVLVMTGGADVLGLGSWLPKLLDTKLLSSSTVNWIKGPYANSPNVPLNPNLTWKVHDSPKDIDKIISQSSYILTQFGVSFFEALQYGIPTVVFPLDPYENNLELDKINKENAALVSYGIRESVDLLLQLMGDDFLARKLSETSKNKMHVSGCDLFANKINKLMRH